MTDYNLTTAIILGFAVGDALGVPFEFMEEIEIDFKFSDEMVGEGTYNQPAGTFSDDTSTMCCTIEAMIENNSLMGMADNFIKWKNENYWTARGEVFDIGNTTLVALKEYENTGDLSGSATNNEYNCGNGSLMRILPLLPYTINLESDEKFEFIRKVSSITHGHIRCAIACFIYLEMAEKFWLDRTGSKNIIYSRMLKTVMPYLTSKKDLENELSHFQAIFDGPTSIPKEEISNSGYVVDSLFLSFHCFMRYNRYEMNVWYAISFGGDTDTNAALTGALSALMGGIREIPERWLNNLAKKEDLQDLANRWSHSIKVKNQVLIY
jgi:ADP-ribosyl-[dinitrogen reductase] hydrolase